MGGVGLLVLHRDHAVKVFVVHRLPGFLFMRHGVLRLRHLWSGGFLAIVDVLTELLADARVAFAADPGAAGEFVGAGGAWSTGLEAEEAEVLAGVDPVEVAAWTVAASTVLNMDSFLTKE